MDNDDPLLQELLDLDGEEGVGDSTATAASGTQYTGGATQYLNAQLASQSQGAALNQAAEPSVTQPQPRPSPQQLAAGQQMPQERRLLLGSNTLTVLVTMLLKLLANDQARTAQVKLAVKAAQELQDIKAASNELMQELNRICGSEMIKHVVWMQKRYRQQHQQAAGQGQAQVPASPQQQIPQQHMPPPQQTVPQQTAIPPQQLQHGAAMPSRGVSPAPGSLPQQPQQLQAVPPVQQQVPVQHPVAAPQQPRAPQAGAFPGGGQAMPGMAGMTPNAAFNVHLQAQQQAQLAAAQQAQQAAAQQAAAQQAAAQQAAAQQAAAQQAAAQQAAAQQVAAQQAAAQQAAAQQAAAQQAAAQQAAAQQAAAQQAAAQQAAAQQAAAQQAAAQQAAAQQAAAQQAAARSHMPAGMVRPAAPMLPTMPGQQTLGLPQVASTAAAFPKPRPAMQQVKRAGDVGGDDGRDAKRAKGPAAGRKEKEGDMHDILDADAFIDMEQETDQLMAGLAHQRQMGTAKVAKTQLLSEWRVANEMLKQLTKAGLKRVKPECFEILQLAFQAHATRILTKAHSMARHRQDNARKVADMVTVSDPRRGVAQIERRERAKYDARLAAERENLLKAAQSKKADEETKEKAQKAKAELLGQQQASAANAAVAARLSKSAKWNKWDKWGGGGGGDAKPAAGGGKKKGKAAAVKEDGKGAAAAEASGTEGAPDQAAAGAEATPGGRVAEPAGAGEGAPGQLSRPGSSLQASRPRPVLGGGDEGGDTIHLRDIVAVLERDPMYCKSPQLYMLMNRV